MKNYKIIFTPIIFLLVFTFALTCEAQNNPVYKIMKQRGWNSPLDAHSMAKGISKMTSKQLITEEILMRGYDDTTVTNLQKDGVDLLHLRNLPRPLNEKVNTALSDCIVIGKVISITHPFKENFWYHTLAYVEVEEFLRNDYQIPKEIIQVLIASGPTKPGQIMVQAGEDTLGIGEHVLLFLSANELIEIASNNNMRDWYNQLINDSTIKFRIIKKFDIESGGKLISRGMEKSLSNVKDDIKSVLAILHRNLSTNK